MRTPEDAQTRREDAETRRRGDTETLRLSPRLRVFPLRVLTAFACALGALGAEIIDRFASVEQRPDGYWIVWTNTPPRFQISCTTNFADWTPYLKKESGDSLNTIELRFHATNDLPERFWKLEAL